MLYDNDGLRALSAVHQFGNGFIQIGETIFWMGLSYTARNPGEALAITFMLSNPTFRGILAKMLRHQLGHMAVDLRFYGRLVPCLLNTCDAADEEDSVGTDGRT